MKKLNFDGKDLYEIFGVSNEREAELTYQMNLAKHELFRPIKGTDDVNITDVDILKAYTSFAQNEEEFRYCLFISGRVSQKIHSMSSAL